VLRFDAAGNIIGLTIIDAKWLLERDGELVVTLPEQVHTSASSGWRRHPGAILSPLRRISQDPPPHLPAVR
jgi:hypothetical protein